MDITVRLLGPGDVAVIDSAFSEIGWRRRREMLEGYLGEQQKGERTVLVAYSDHDFAGYVTVKWHSDYPPFAEESIPEVMDLNVLPRFRRRRIATRLMDEAERLVFERSLVVGIGVGTLSDYGPAQRMYVRRGYVPDGLGLFHQGRHVRAYQEVRVDDDLVLYFTKERRRKRCSALLGEAATREWFTSLKNELESAYLKHSEPWKQSGLMIDDGTAWTACRKPIADCIEKSGTFLDIGCANGYLLETVLGWTKERSLTIVPYGIDLSKKLVALAKRRLPRYERNFFVGNAFYWNSPPRFDYVHSEIVYVPESLRRRYVERLLDSYLKREGKLLLTEYRSRKDAPDRPWIDQTLAEWGIAVEREASGFYDGKEVTRVMVIPSPRVS